MGSSTAKVFLREGWTVIALDIAPVDETIDGPGRLISVVADVRDRAAVKAALDAALPERELIDAVANVAGVYPPSTIDNYDEATYRRVFDINVLGTLNVTAEAVARMGNGGAIVNFASVDAFTVSPGQLLYGASKAAVVMLTKELATPGNAATGRMDAAAASIPLGRVAQPEEIAEWVWLLSHGAHAAFLTGETVVLSGGDVMR
jgi:NAD(P)-dependent dehydrogenase (short-subunit alcohol dehydrogenase family)